MAKKKRAGKAGTKAKPPARRPERKVTKKVTRRPAKPAKKKPAPPARRPTPKKKPAPPARRPTPKKKAPSRKPAPRTVSRSTRKKIAQTLRRRHAQERALSQRRKDARAAYEKTIGDLMRRSELSRVQAQGVYRHERAALKEERAAGIPPPAVPVVMDWERTGRLPSPFQLGQEDPNLPARFPSGSEIKGELLVPGLPGQEDERRTITFNTGQTAQEFWSNFWAVVRVEIEADRVEHGEGNYSAPGLAWIGPAA